MVKKYVLWIITAIVLILLAGCGEEELDPASPPSSTANESGTLKAAAPSADKPSPSPQSPVEQGHAPELLPASPAKATVQEAMSAICGCQPDNDKLVEVKGNHAGFDTVTRLEKTGEDKLKGMYFFTERVDKVDKKGVVLSSVTNKYTYDAAKSTYVMTESENNSVEEPRLSCGQALEQLGQFSVADNLVDYKSGFRIFPLLHFILTKKSIPASMPDEAVFMEDNPIFVTRDEPNASSLLLAPIHSRRTGALHGVTGFPDNVVTKYYEPMVIGKENGNVKQVPSTDVGPLNKLVEVNRKTWMNDLAEYTEPCSDSLKLPPMNGKGPFFNFNGQVYPFSKEMDFAAGADGIGYGLKEHGVRYPAENQIQIPILLYCPDCKVESVTMVQNQTELKFTLDELNAKWREWLGDDWFLFLSEPIDFDEKVFSNAELEKMTSTVPPFINNRPSVIYAKINGKKVEYVNQ
jgi:hypothetical protein